VSIAAICDTIAMAKHHEQKTGHLAQLLQHQLDQNIHTAIQLPAHKPLDSLLRFVIAYIDHVPEFLQATAAITENAGIHSFAQPYLQLAADFFLKPPEMVSGHIGLDELMDEAYLAHRLMEEVNDRFMLRAGIPLVPMDMTLSNLLIHSLIGEPFANQLDNAVHLMVQQTRPSEAVYDSPAFKSYVTVHQNNNWEQEYQHWPCLIDQLAIELRFNAS
jgi:hypothetical protein